MVSLPTGTRNSGTPFVPVSGIPAYRHTRVAHIPVQPYRRGGPDAAEEVGADGGGPARARRRELLQALAASPRLLETWETTAR